MTPPFCRPAPLAAAARRQPMKPWLEVLLPSTPVLHSPVAAGVPRAHCCRIRPGSVVDQDWAPASSGEDHVAGPDRGRPDPVFGTGSSRLPRTGDSERLAIAAGTTPVVIMSGSAAQSANAKKKQRQRAKAAAAKAAAGPGDTPSGSAPETATAGKAVKEDEEELQPSASAETEGSIGAPAVRHFFRARVSRTDGIGIRQHRQRLHIAQS